MQSRKEQGCVGWPLGCRWALLLMRLSRGACVRACVRVCVCVHALCLCPSPAELFENLHMQQALILGNFPQLRGVLPLAENKLG